MSWIDLAERLGMAPLHGAEAAAHGIGDVFGASHNLGQEALGKFNVEFAQHLPGVYNLQTHTGAPSAAEIIAAYKAKGVKGAEARYQQNQPGYEHTLEDIVNPLDPVNAVGWMAGAPALRGLAEGATIGRDTLAAQDIGGGLIHSPGLVGVGKDLGGAGGKALELLGKGLWYGGIRSQEVPGELLGKGIGHVAGKVADLPLMRSLLADSTRTLANRGKASLQDALKHTAENAQGLGWKRLEIVPSALRKPDGTIGYVIKAADVKKATSDLIEMAPTLAGTTDPLGLDATSRLGVVFHDIAVKAKIPKGSTPDAATILAKVNTNALALKLGMDPAVLQANAPAAAQFAARLFAQDQHALVQLTNPYNLADEDVATLFGRTYGPTASKTAPKSYADFVVDKTPGEVADAYYRTTEKFQRAIDTFTIPTPTPEMLSNRAGFGKIVDSVGAAVDRYNVANGLKGKLKLDPREYENNLIFLHDHGINPWQESQAGVRTEPLGLSFQAMTRLTDIEHGIEPDKVTGWDLYKRAWRAQVLASPTYHERNLVNNWMQNVMAGYGINANPQDLWLQLRHAFANRSLADQITSGVDTTARRQMDRWGYQAGPRVTHLSQEAVYVPTAGAVDLPGGVGPLVRKTLTKIGTPDTLATTVAKAIDTPFAWNRAFGNAIESMNRESLFAAALNNHMIPTVDSLVSRATIAADKQGIMAPDHLDQMFQGLPNDVKTRLMAGGFNNGQAEHLMRAYANERNTAYKEAGKLVGKAQFDYNFTKLDEYVNKVIPFHYWASRAVPFYLQSTFEHPVFLKAYTELNRGYERSLNDPGTSARQKGFMKMMAGPTGFTLLMNPKSLVGAIQQLGFMDSNQPGGDAQNLAGASWLGRVLNVGQKYGIQLYPWVGALFNYAGVYGDTFGPDPIGMREQGLIGAAIQEVNALSGNAPLGAPYQSAQVALRGSISNAIAPYLPLGIAHGVDPKESPDGTIGTASLDKIIGSRVMAMHPDFDPQVLVQALMDTPQYAQADPTMLLQAVSDPANPLHQEAYNEKLMAVLNDPESPEYQDAYKSAAGAGILQQFLNFTVPGNFHVRENTADVRDAALTTIRKAAKAANVSPQDYVPTEGDAQFAVQYKQQTGQIWNPRSFSDNQFRKDLAQGTPAARPFIVQSYEYGSLGDAATQAMFKKYQKIRGGEIELPGMPPASSLNPQQLDFLANEWLYKNDPTRSVLKLQQLQGLYKDTHKEFAQFKSWQGTMFNLKTALGDSGFSLYRQTVSQHNPNAARYFTNLTKTLKALNPTKTPTELLAILDNATISPDAWMAVTGQTSSQFQNKPLSTGSYTPYDPATAIDQAQQAQTVQNREPYAGPVSMAQIFGVQSPAPQNPDWQSTLARYGL